MKNLFHSTSIPAFLMIALLLAACNSTSVTGVWKKSDFTGKPFQSILVVGLTKDQTNKDIWEDIMVDQLKLNGVNATTSAKCFPGDPKITKNEILNYVKKQGIGAVLITRLIDTKKEKTYYPPTGRYYGDYYYGDPRHRYYNNFGTFYDTVYTPGYTSTYTTVILETTLYDAATQDLVWSMSSDTFDPSSTHNLARSVSKQVVKTLQKSNLIRRIK